MLARTSEGCCEDHYNAGWAVLSVFAHKSNGIYDCPSAFLFSEARLQGKTTGHRASVHRVCTICWSPWCSPTW